MTTTLPGNHSYSRGFLLSNSLFPKQQTVSKKTAEHKPHPLETLRDSISLCQETQRETGQEMIMPTTTKSKLFAYSAFIAIFFNYLKHKLHKIIFNITRRQKTHIKNKLEAGQTKRTIFNSEDPHNQKKWGCYNTKTANSFYAHGKKRQQYHQL